MAMRNLHLLLCMISLFTGSLSAASFDCAQANSASEKTICSDSYLSFLDETLFSTYQEAWALSQDQEGLRQTQRDWLSSRDQCTDIDCLTTSIQQRNLQLIAYVAAAKDEASKRAYAAETEAWEAQMAAERDEVAERLAQQAAQEQLSIAVAEEKRLQQMQALKEKADAEELARKETWEQQHAEAAVELQEGQYEDYLAEPLDTTEDASRSSKSEAFSYWWLGFVIFFMLLIFERPWARSSSSSSSSSSSNSRKEDDDDYRLIAKTDSNEIPHLQQTTYYVGKSPISRACGSCSYWSGRRFTHPKMGSHLLVEKNEKGDCKYPVAGSPRGKRRVNDGMQCKDFTPR